jgi:hypothetical protein
MLRATFFMMPKDSRRRRSKAEQSSDEFDARAEPCLSERVEAPNSAADARPVNAGTVYGTHAHNTPPNVTRAITPVQSAVRFIPCSFVPNNQASNSYIVSRLLALSYFEIAAARMFLETTIQLHHLRDGHCHNHARFPARRLDHRAKGLDDLGGLAGAFNNAGGRYCGTGRSARR